MQGVQNRHKSPTGDQAGDRVDEMGSLCTCKVLGLSSAILRCRRCSNLSPRNIGMPRFSDRVCSRFALAFSLYLHRVPPAEQTAA